MMSKQPTICVIGGGIMGFSSAYCLAKKFPKCRLTMIYDECSPNTTSNHSFGNCVLRNLNDFDNPMTPSWGKQTVEYCYDIFRRSPQLANEMGMHLLTGYFAYDVGQNSKSLNSGGPPKDAPTQMRKISGNEITELGYYVDQLDIIFEREGVKIGDLNVYESKTWVINNDIYLPWMKKDLGRMMESGELSSLEFVKKRVNNFSEVTDNGSYDFIVNCSGLGSEYLVPDSNMIPIRGQYVIVQRDDVTEICVGRSTYICPRPGRVALGAVYQIGRRDTKIYSKDREDILRRCYALNPKLKESVITKEGVGIRPARRGGARVEVEIDRTFKNGVKVPIIHNYGHGAKGILQHWGCALEVAKMATLILNRKPKS